MNIKVHLKNHCTTIRYYLPQVLLNNEKKAQLFYLFFKFIFIFIFLCYVRTTPTAYRGSQARSLIKAVATGLRYSHSNTGSEPHL